MNRISGGLRPTHSGTGKPRLPKLEGRRLILSDGKPFRVVREKGR